MATLGCALGRLPLGCSAFCTLPSSFPCAASPASQTRNWLPCQRRRRPLPCPEEELNGTCARAWNNLVSARAESPRHFRPQQLVQAKPQWARGGIPTGSVDSEDRHRHVAYHLLQERFWG